LTIDEFKKKLIAYESGNLSPVEAEKFEKELEKLDEYQAFLEAYIGDTSNPSPDHPNVEKKVLRRSQSAAYFRMGLVALIVSLLLLPTLNLFALILGVLP